MAKETSHVVEQQLGGDPQPGRARYSRALIVLPDDWYPKKGVPATRADCPVSRPCPYVRCEWNLWMIDGRDRPGRRHGEGPPSVVIAHNTQNCGADVAEASARERISIKQVADAIGISDRQVRRIVKQAKAKLEKVEGAAEVLKLMVEK